MEIFDELAFVYALTTRPEDARRFSGHFLPEWLNNQTLVPVCQEIYTFLHENGLPPSIPALHMVMKDKDEEAYNLRYKKTLEEIEARKPDLPEMLYVIGQARDVAIVRSFQNLFNSPASLRMQADFDGREILGEVQKWASKFLNVKDDETLTIDEAIRQLLEYNRPQHKRTKLPTGIYPIDKWTKGGIRSSNLGIILASTGVGKSCVLMNIAYAAAAFELKNVWMVTNELTITEQAERFLSRLSNMSMSVIEDDPLKAYKGLSKRWLDLNKRLILTYINREVTCDELEAEMMRQVNLTGWMPDVVVLDHLERMRPNTSGWNRDQSWNWMGAIASDLVRFAKRHKIVVWTASQLNRKVIEAAKMTIDHAQGSIKHLQEAAVVVGLEKAKSKSEEDQVLKFTALKLRHSRMPSKSLYVKSDLDKMTISSQEYNDGEADNEVDRGGAGGRNLKKFKTP